MIEEEISVSMEQYWLECFCEVISLIDGRVDSVKEHEVAFDPVT